jgi:N-acetylmuramoyl-L-alanine amidase
MMSRKISKCLFVLLSVLFLSLLGGTLWAQSPKSVVVIDPAHGGDDVGVISVDGTQEKNLTLAIAQAIKKDLADELNMEVVLTRDSDQTISQDERKKVISGIKPALVLSLHVNAGFGKTASGFEVYYPGFKEVDQTKKGKKSNVANPDQKRLNDTVKLARLIQKNLDTLFPRRGRGLREASTPLMEGMQVPVLIVEMGFATNPDEKKKLNSVKTQADIAKALAKSIQAFF